MKNNNCTWLFWVLLSCFAQSCNDPQGFNTKLVYSDKPDSSTVSVPEAEEFLVFQNGVRAYPNPNTTVSHTLLTQRDGYATTLIDPYDYVWTMTAAVGLTDQDFANAGVYLSSVTDDGAKFYYGKVNAWEISADCVVYVAASEQDFLTIRRNQDQGACPTAAGYSTWLPRADTVDAHKYQSTRAYALTAYGANNHQNNIIHGEFNGIKIYGNDPYGWPCNDFQIISHCLAYAGIRLTGTKWDSAEFVSRYFITQFNQLSLWQGPSKYWYKNNYGFKKMPNCGSVPPEIGDMLVSEGGSHGHAAIVREVSDHSVTVIQQNWFESEKDNHYMLSMTTSGNRHCISKFGDGYPIVGWLRK